MHFNCLPTEIIQIIFSYLPGSDVLNNCRNVNQRWKDVVEGMRDDFWKSACKAEFAEVYEDAYRKSNITWLQLYDSLSLWNQVASAKVKTKPSSIRANNFTTLANNRISIPHRTYEGSLKMSCVTGYNTIIYYNLETMKECHREAFDYLFKHYIENDNILLLLNNNDQIFIRIKSDMRSFFVGTLHEDALLYNMNLVMLNNEVYFKDKYHNFTICTSVVKDGKNIIETKRLGYLKDDIEAVVRVNDKKVNMLTVDGHVVNIKNDELEGLFVLDSMKDNNIGLLERSGFKWSSPIVFDHLLRCVNEDDEIPKSLRYFKSPVICSFGDIIVVGTSRNYIHIFKTWLNTTSDSDDDYEYLADLDFDAVSLSSFLKDKMQYRAKKCKSICLKNIFTNQSLYNPKRIQKIDVVETIKGHKIIVLYCSRILVIDLYHGEMKTPPKRRSTSKGDLGNLKKMKLNPF